ncbi:ligase-associated DNA damage response endonuclease PdeM [Xanthobacter agilis]|uniref:DNA ligase-associated metallophosphoesterase n=1 Tax=Xanthobacter agilis TaxID=47492 RepID=A0ABU0L8N6_XANAG|nr:ligase-associated DNA damage response endonuclease PdeM [Xanthobacter agilis]MDQ0503501.1 DNA ligase-associated metallophosphoesterase [Xanthobacter agilis]
MLAHADSPPLSPARIGLAGAELLLDPSGAALWVEERLLVVADMHLEKGSAFARRGQMLPPFDTRETLDRLGRLVARHQPRTVVALGDSLHDRWAGERLDADARGRLRTLAAAVELIWIAGNHDPAPHDLGGRCAEMLSIGPLRFRHEPELDARAGEVCGHLHPAARVVVRGRGVRRRCFVTDGARLVLPAFGAFTGGLDVSAPAISGLFGPGAFDVHLLGEDRTFRLPAPRLGAP